jgi:hypothetical protein
MQNTNFASGSKDKKFEHNEDIGTDKRRLRITVFARELTSFHPETRDFGVFAYLF